MDINTIKYILGEIDFNIYYDITGKPALKIQKEEAPNGHERHQVIFLDKDYKHDRDYISVWLTPEQADALKNGNEIEQQKKKPKHTGGKQPYLMLMINEIEKLRDGKIKNIEELIGYVVCLGKYIEWNTGKLVKSKRRKKHEPLRYKDLLEIFKCSNGKLAKTINQLKDIGVLEYREIDGEKAYYISQKYIKKGKSEKS